MNKLKYDYIIYIIGVCCVILLLGTSLVIDYLNDNVFDDVPIINKSEYRYKNNYTIQINYPKVENRSINKEIKKLVKNEKKQFLKNVKKHKSYESELNINYSYVYVSNLYSIHIRSYSSVGKDNDYTRSDKVIYYDALNKKEIDIDKIIVSDKFYEILRNKTYTYLKNNKEQYNIKDMNSLSKRLTAIKDNYDIVGFSKDDIEVSLEPNSVSDYKYEIHISIKYEDTIKYLNNSYINIDSNINAIKDNYVSKNYDRIRDSKDFTNKKIVAITFDDGPAYNKTEKLLEELDKRDARVTFFMLGELAKRQTDLVKKAYNYGHTIGSHTYDHKNLKKLDPEEIDFEIDYTNEILSNIIGEDIKFVRPPYGAYNSDILKQVNMAFILWNEDTLDWKYRNAEKVRDYIVEHASDGDIILLHDIHATSVEGAIMAIDILKEKGFEFVSLEEMLVYKNIDIENNKAYRFFK